jgi:large subunit ribosomal protein L23
VLVSTPLASAWRGEGRGETRKQYTFKVAKDANKLEIRAAVEALFEVKVKAVNVMNRMGKLKRTRMAGYGRRPDWKKAVVTLSEGQIDIL